MARKSARPPRAKQPLPPPLPPERRTVGQLVAESVRFYRHHFWQSLPLGLSVAVLTQAAVELGKDERRSPFEATVDYAWRRSHGILLERGDGSDLSLTGVGGGGVFFTATVGGVLLTLAYVFACALVSRTRIRMRAGLIAAFAGFAAFFPAPFLALLFVLPAIAWLAFVGLVVPVAVIEGTDLRESFSRAFRLARVDYVHALGGLATLILTFFLTRLVLVLLLHGAGESTTRVAVFLADLVISPVLFIGSALLYYDQAARLSSGLSRSERRRRNADLHHALEADGAGNPDAELEPGPAAGG